MITAAGFLLLMFVGVPIGLCLCLAGVIYILAIDSPVLFQTFPVQMFTAVDSYGLIAIPLFILIGEVMNGGGITQRIVAMAMAFVGAMRGGLAYVNILANMMVASILGSATAQVAVMSQIMTPQMHRKGYDLPFAAGLTAYAGMLGSITPPSIMLIVYSVLAQVAVSDMMLAGLLPGLTLVVLFCILTALLGFVHQYPMGEKLPWRERIRIILNGVPTLIIPVVIVGSIVTGIANPTEAAAVGAVMAILIGRFWTRELKFSMLPQMLTRAGIFSGIILFLVAAAGVFSWVLIFGKVPHLVASWLQEVATGPISFMLLANLLLLLIGTVIDGIPGLIMTVPILLPIATDIYGIDPRHFGVVVTVNLVLGLLSPPVGLCLFIASAVTGANVGKIFMRTLPYFFVTCILLVLLSIFPFLSLGLF